MIAFAREQGLFSFITRLPVWALGVIAVELLTGQRPFPGPGVEDYREQHLHASPGRLDVEPPRLAALVEECLYKAPGARPSPANLLARLEGVSEQPRSSGVSRLGRAYQAEAARQGDERLAASRARTELERREELYAAARHSLTVIAQELLKVVRREAPSVQWSPAFWAPLPDHRRPPHDPGVGWRVKFKGAALSLGGPALVADAPWGDSQRPAFDVVAHGGIEATLPPEARSLQRGYWGRSHSLYFCDAALAGAYGWFETAFMWSPLITRRHFAEGWHEPFAVGPGADAARALCAGMADYQVAWPFTPLVIGDLGEFVDRWVGWFADAVEGRLAPPSNMPERPVDRTWRQS